MFLHDYGDHNSPDVLNGVSTTPVAILTKGTTRWPDHAISRFHSKLLLHLGKLTV